MKLFSKKKNKLVFCTTCGTCLGKYRPKFAKAHLRKFPDHDGFLVKTLTDPFKLPNLDEWLEMKMKHYDSSMR